MEGSLAESHVQFLAEPAPVPAKDQSEKIGVVGLGYVGLPVSIALAERYETVIGFDLNRDRITSLRLASDWTNEVTTKSLLTTELVLTDKIEDLGHCSIIIVAVPTPINRGKRPDFEPLLNSCRLIGPSLKRDTIVVFESTVYPGATEDICGPELEKYSGLRSGVDFHLAYSPERISPGEKQRGFKASTKIVSAQSHYARDRVGRIYQSVVDAGVHYAPSIKVAEAAKVFENTQRDVNVALMNELSEICEALGIHTSDVVAATATKWNALPFTPGLVGGHCISVDPHYLATCAEQLGLSPDLIVSARKRNEAVVRRIVMRAMKFLGGQDKLISRARVGIMGVTFKENVPDTRNSKVLDIVAQLRELGLDPVVSDPVAAPRECETAKIQLQPLEALIDLDLLILAVPHQSYLVGKGRYIQEKLRRHGLLMDLRSALNREHLRDDIHYWSL